MKTKFFTDYDLMLSFTLGLIKKGKSFSNKGGSSGGWTVVY
jgi:hypothetical protein